MFFISVHFLSLLFPSLLREEEGRVSHPRSLPQREKGITVGGSRKCLNSLKLFVSSQWEILRRRRKKNSGEEKQKQFFFPENIHFIPRQLSFFPPKMYWAHSGNSPLYDAPLLFFFVHTLGLDGKNTIPPFLLLQSPCCHRRVKTPSFLLFP